MSRATFWPIKLIISFNFEFFMNVNALDTNIDLILYNNEIYFNGEEYIVKLWKI